MGKRFICLWLNGDLSDSASESVDEYLETNKSSFVQGFYAKPDFRQITALSRLVLKYEEEEVVKRMLEHYFDEFIEFSVYPLCKKDNYKSFSTIGSVGRYFESYICASAKKFGLSVIENVQNPISKLSDFHLSQD